MAMKIRFELPDELIHHIQSFMNGKEAVGTCLLSKSWYHAWCTRPILAFHFDIKKQCIKEDAAAAILESIRKSMKRYKESKINLQKLEIRITRKYYCNSLIDKLIGDVSEFGVDEIHLEGNWCLPPTVFTVTRLTKLSIRGCSIKKLPPVDTILPLVSLRLNLVDVGQDNSIIQGILLRCPSIENLDIQYMYQETSINLGELHNLVNLRVDLVYRRTKVSFHSITNGRLVNTVREFHKLRSVCLDCVRIEGGFFTNFSSRFPCIEDLSLHRCTGYDRCIKISSKSLKYLNLVLSESQKTEKAEFDVANIRKFGFESDHIPALSVSTMSREWESRVGFSLRCQVVDASWFVQLGELLKGLSKSRISLHLNTDFVYVSGDLPCSPTALVENLTVSTYNPSQAQNFLTASIVCFRPTCITLMPADSNMFCYQAIEFVQHAQKLFANHQNNATKCSSVMESLITYDIKKFELLTVGGEWRTIEMKKFVNDLELSRPSAEVGSCFRVTWGASNVAETSLQGTNN